METDEGKKLYSGKQFRRTPFVTSFQSGWFKFDICTVHIYFGEESGAKLEERCEEIETIAKYFGKRAKKANHDDKALILLGDFNIRHPDHKTMTALTDQGFTVPKTLQDPTNFSGTKYYDQIAFIAEDEVLDYIETETDDLKQANAGILDIYKNLYKAGQWSDYKGQMHRSPNGEELSDAELKKYYKKWLTYQLSDHRPLWVRIKTNDRAAYLDQMRADAMA